MKYGTKVIGTLITTQYLIKDYNSNIETAASAMLSGLKTAVSGEGLEIYEIGEARKVYFTNASRKEKDKLNAMDECVQIRQPFTLILSKTLSKDKVYQVVNLVQSQPLRFS